MIGLKSFSGFLGEVLGVSATALYERQRALVRAGVLPEAERGRGKGLQATPETVGLLILAVLVTDSLSETDERVGRLASLPVDEKRKRCRLTGKSTLIDVTAEILSKPEIAKRVWFIKVDRTSLAASISWNRDGSDKWNGSRFGGYLDVTKDVPMLEVEATLHGAALRKIASLLEADRYIDMRQPQQSSKQKEE